VKPELVNTTRQVVRVKTGRGVLTIGPHGKIDGLWALIKRELRTNQQVRTMCGKVTRTTLLTWRKTKGFPEPVLTYKAKGGQLELWSRTEIEQWLAARPQKPETPWPYA
jgi:predicted DNA-binding transcriptional regulator AlpA